MERKSNRGSSRPVKRGQRPDQSARGRITAWTPTATLNAVEYLNVVEHVGRIITETIGKSKVVCLRPRGRKVLEQELPLILAAYRFERRWETAPPPSLVVKEYRAIEKLADHLLAKLGFRESKERPGELEWFQLSPTTLPPWVGLAGLADLDPNGPGYEELLATVGGVRRIRVLAKNAVEAAQKVKADTPSRHAGKQAQRGTILRLIGVYERAFDRRFGVWKRGGSRKGPGIRFVTACFDVIGEKVAPSLIEDVASERSRQRSATT